MAPDEATTRRVLRIVNRLGLHARAAARLATLAAEYQADIDVHFQGHVANAKSIMGLMMLAAGQGSELELAAHGPDATDAVTAIEQLVADRFGEDD